MGKYDTLVERRTISLPRPHIDWDRVIRDTSFMKQGTSPTEPSTNVAIVPCSSSKQVRDRCISSLSHSHLILRVT